MLSPTSGISATRFTQTKKWQYSNSFFFPLVWPVLLCRTSLGILGQSKAMDKTKGLQSTYLALQLPEKDPVLALSLY